MIEDKNRIILSIGKVHSASVSPWVVRFSVGIYNEVDNTDTYHKTNSDDIQGYLEKEDLERILKGIRKMVEVYCEGLPVIDSIERT